MKHIFSVALWSLTCSLVTWAGGHSGVGARMTYDVRQDRCCAKNRWVARSCPLSLSLVTRALARCVWSRTPATGRGASERGKAPYHCRTILSLRLKFCHRVVTRRAVPLCACALPHVVTVLQQTSTFWHDTPCPVTATETRMRLGEWKKYRAIHTIRSICTAAVVKHRQHRGGHLV